MIHVMCDLETLGRRPGCKLLSIGAVVFGPKGLGAEFYEEVKINHQGDLTADQSTIDWWNQQSPEARDRLYGGQDTKPTLRQALEKFNAWLEQLAMPDAKGNLELCLWGNGADFDNAILQVAYDKTTMEQPSWPFWNNRCYRTLKNLAPSVKLVRQGVYHNALDDAKSQAEHAVRLMDQLKAW
jgi:hypothetical protein